MPEAVANGSNGSYADIDDADIDFTDIEEKYAVRFDEGLDDVVVVDNVPVIGKEREQKLLETLVKRFKSHGGIDVDANNFHVPYGEDGQSKGYLFLELASPEDANQALRMMDGYPFDKRHRLAVNRFTDVEKLANLDEEYQEPEEEEYKDREHLRSWLTDYNGRDQLVMCRGDDVSIAWNNRTAPPEIVHNRERWTESYVQWTPQGTFLATLHRQGLALWGGPSFQRFMRFSHSNVRLVDFSPNERYMVTWSPDAITVPENAPTGPQFFGPEDEGNRIAVWEVRTGHLLRTFPVAQESEQAGAGFKAFSWPMLKWSGDDKYVARVNQGKSISVYELPGMGMLDKNSIKIEGVIDFEWCPLGDKDRDALEAWGDGSNPPKGAKKPRENMIAFWVPEVANQPARATVMAIPSREIARSKNLFNVSDCKLHWHPQGDYLCVKVDRHTKTKKSLFCNFELFRMREKDFPVEVVELKDPVIAFAWEPNGSHFVVLSSNDPNFGNAPPGVTIKSQINFFHLDAKKGDFRLAKTIDNKTANTIFWSPRGRHVIIATMGSSAKFDLEWYDVDFSHEIRQGSISENPADDIKEIGKGEHYGITDLEWDPSGRFVSTSASVWRHALENGYAIWDFKGQELQKVVIDRFKQLLWRPRPRSLLTKEDQKRVRRSLREIGRTLDEEDAALESQLALQHKEVYLRAVEEWRAWRAKTKAELEEQREALGKEAEPLPQEIEEEATEVIEEWQETILEETEEILD